MQREFTLAIFYKIFYPLIGTALIVFSIFMTAAPAPGPMIYMVSLLMIAAGIALGLNGIRRKVTIENDVITYRDIFSTKEIAFSNIKGVRTGRKGITIESDVAGDPTIFIRNYIEFSDSFQLLDFLKGKFQDLDAINLEQEQNSILQNPDLGFTTEDRQARLDNAKTIAILYNVVGAIVAALGLVLRQPNYTVVLIIYPVLSVVIMLTSKGLIKFLSDKKRSIYPFVFIGFIAPAIILFIKTVADFHLLSYDNFWLPFAGILCVIFVPLFTAGVNRSLSSSVIGQGLLMFVISIFYSVGVVGQVNSQFDNSPDHIYKASVLGHHITRGKSTTYYLYLGTWGPCQQQKEISVSQTMYNKTQPGDSVKIDLKAGLLHIPWFVVKR